MTTDMEILLAFLRGGLVAVVVLAVSGFFFWRFTPRSQRSGVGLGAGSNGTEGPYRSVDNPPRSEEELLSYQSVRCPSCGTHLSEHCNVCGMPPKKWKSNCGEDLCSGAIVAGRPLRVRACSPSGRLRVGWFRRCKVQGTHLHVECRMCGWRSVTKTAFDMRPGQST